jgi:hypothetical protein
MKCKTIEKIRRMKPCKLVHILSVIAVIALIQLSVMTNIFPQSELLKPAMAARFTLLVEEDIYTPGETMVIYGAGAPNDSLIVRIFDPSGIAIRIDNIETTSDGFFREAIFRWPEPSVSVPFGSYAVEVISSLDRVDMRRVEVTFAEAVEEDQGPRLPVSHTLGIKLDSPAQASINEPFRIFIQVTFDGALVAVEDAAVPELLGTSHLHSGNTTISLEDKLKRLHEGLYYADVTIAEEGAYIIHSVAFHRGLLSHDSKVITATSSSISTIQESVRELDLRLNSTNRELKNLQQGIEETRSSLNDTQSAITASVQEARMGIRGDIDAMQQATGQINSLILPVLALISVIIALQISLFARIRASFR